MLVLPPGSDGNASPAARLGGDKPRAGQWPPQAFRPIRLRCVKSALHLIFFFFVFSAQICAAALNSPPDLPDYQASQELHSLGKESVLTCSSGCRTKNKPTPSDPPSHSSCGCPPTGPPSPTSSSTRPPRCCRWVDVCPPVTEHSAGAAGCRLEISPLLAESVAGGGGRFFPPFLTTHRFLWDSSCHVLVPGCGVLVLSDTPSQ